jgi:hypothetical protein
VNGTVGYVKEEFGLLRPFATCPVGHAPQTTNALSLECTAKNRRGPASGQVGLISKCWEKAMTRAFHLMED